MALSRSFSEAASPRAVTARLRGVTGEADAFGAPARIPPERTPPGFHFSGEVSAVAAYCDALARRNKQVLVSECRRLGIRGNMNVPKATLMRRIRAELLRRRRDAAIAHAAADAATPVVGRGGPEPQAMQGSEPLAMDAEGGPAPRDAASGFALPPTAQETAPSLPTPDPTIAADAARPSSPCSSISTDSSPPPRRGRSLDAVRRDTRGDLPRTSPPSRHLPASAEDPSAGSVPPALRSCPAEAMDGARDRPTGMELVDPSAPSPEDQATFGADAAAPGPSKRPAPEPDGGLPDLNAPPTWRRRQTGMFHSQLSARRMSQYGASVRPARLDEILALQAEVRRLNVCLRGLVDAEQETQADLEAKVSRALAELAGGPVRTRNVFRAGRFSARRPRPVIIAFNDLATKVKVLRSKAVLYSDSCPPELRGLRLYHDLSPLQLRWKVLLRPSYDFFQDQGTRAIWRNGYRLMAYTHGSWEEYVPNEFLVSGIRGYL